MSVEEFILIPKNTFVRQRPVIEQIFADPDIKSKTSQLNYLSRMKNVGHEANDKPIVPPNVKQQTLNELTSFTPAQLTRASLIYDKVLSSDNYSIDNNGILLYKNYPTSITVSTWLHNLQQPNKILSTDELDIVKRMKIPAHLVANRRAKIATGNSIPTAKGTLDGQFEEGEQSSPKKSKSSQGSSNWESFN
jgi:hypothetical protein